MITTEAPGTIEQEALPTSAPIFVRTRLVLMFYVVAGLYSLVPSSFGPLMPFMRSELHFDYTTTALHFSALAFGVIVSGSIGDKVLKHFGRKRALWGGLAGAALGVIILVTNHIACFTIFGTLVIGLFGSILGQTIDTVFAEQLGDQRTIAITETNIVVSTCAIMAPVVVSTVARMGLNWRTSLILLITLFGVAGFAYRNDTIPEQTAGQKSAEAGTLARAYWGYWVVILLACASEWSIVFWSPDFLEHVAKLCKADASAAVSAFFTAMMTGRIVGSRLSRTMHVRSLLPIAATLSITGFFIFWLGPNPLVNISGLFLAGLGIANMYPLSLSAALAVVPNQLGLGASRMNISTGLAGLCAPLLLGAIADRSGIFSAYAVVAVLLALAVGTIFWANGLARRHDQAQTVA